MRCASSAIASQNAVPTGRLQMRRSFFQSRATPCRRQGRDRLAFAPAASGPQALIEHARFQGIFARGARSQRPLPFHFHDVAHLPRAVEEGLRGRVPAEVGEEALLRIGLDPVGLGHAFGLSRPVPAIDCPTIPLAVDTVIGSDAVMLVSLGMVKREITLHRIVPVFHESWMRSNWAFMKLRHRSPSPAATAFLAALRDVHAASVAEDARLAKRWRARLPPGAVPGNAASRRRRQKSSD